MLIKIALKIMIYRRLIRLGASHPIYAKIFALFTKDYK